MADQPLRLSDARSAIPDLERSFDWASTARSWLHDAREGLDRLGHAQLGEIQARPDRARAIHAYAIALDSDGRPDGVTKLAEA